MKILTLIISVIIVAVLCSYLSMPPMPTVPDYTPVECGAVVELGSTGVNNLLTHYRLQSVPDAENWVCVAILESGWQIDSELVTKHCNPIGMRSRPLFKHISTADGDYCSYPSLADHARDLKKWCNFAPRMQGETFVVFLKRRGYNTDPAYYKMFSEIKKECNLW